MTRQKVVISIKRKNEGFSAVLDGKLLDFDRVAKIVDLVKDEIEQALAGNQNTLERRKFIAYNDTFKGTDQYLGVGKLAKKFGVSTGTIVADRKKIAEKGIVGEAPKQDEPMTQQESVKDEVSEPEQKSSKSKSGKGRKGRH